MPGLQRAGPQARWPQSLCRTAVPSMLAEASDAGQGGFELQPRAGEDIAGNSQPGYAMLCRARMPVEKEAMAGENGA